MTTTDTAALDWTRAKVRPWRGAFDDQALEEAYARAVWPDQRRILRLFLIISIAMTLVYVLNDRLFIDDTATLIFVLGARIAATALGLVAIAMTQKLDMPTSVDRLIIPWVISMAVLILAITLTRPPTHWAGHLQAIGSILALLLLVPTRLREIGLVAAAFAVFQVATIATRAEITPAILGALLPLSLAYVLAVILGFVVGIYWAGLRRQLFATHESDLAARRSLEEAMRIAESASRAKSEFLSGMSHDLRTPMNAIVNYVALLREDVGEMANPQSLQDMARIEGASRLLVEMLDQVLNLSMIEAGKVAITADGVNLGELATNLTNMFEPIASGNNNRLRITATNDIFHTDGKLLVRIATNLISNALKFTKNGGVNVEFSREETSLVLVVADTGIGMKSDQIENIFKPFEQAGPDIRKRFGGTGLGLAIVKRLVELLAGSISIDTNLGHGTIFRVCFPEMVPLTMSDHISAPV